MHTVAQTSSWFARKMDRRCFRVMCGFTVINSCINRFDNGGGGGGSIDDYDVDADFYFRAC